MSRTARKIAQTFSGRVEWVAHGGYFKLLKSGTAVDVELWNKGDFVLNANGVEGGWYQPIDFDKVVITTPSSQEVSWLYAPLGGGQESVNAVGTLGQLAQQAIGGFNTLVVTERGYQAGASFTSTAGLAAGVAEMVLAPASNINGVVVWDAQMSHRGSAVVRSSLLAHTSSPATIVAGEALLVLETESIVPQVAVLPRTRLVAPGKGLYFLADVLTNEGLRSCAYTVL